MSLVRVLYTKILCYAKEGDQTRYDANAIKVKAWPAVGLRIDWREMELRSKVKQAGGKWNSKRRVWEMRYDRVVELGLE